MSDDRSLACVVHADAAMVYGLLAEVELWPALFPHIRSARVLRRYGERRIVSVRANWRGLPIGWRALQTRDRAGLCLDFRHLNALSRGSGVTWTVTRLDDGVRVAVTQRVRLNVPIVGPWLADRLLLRTIGPEMAWTMLGRLKEIAEGGSLAGPA